MPVNQLTQSIGSGLVQPGDVVGAVSAVNAVFDATSQNIAQAGVSLSSFVTAECL